MPEVDPAAKIILARDITNSAIELINDAETARKMLRLLYLADQADAFRGYENQQRLKEMRAEIYPVWLARVKAGFHIKLARSIVRKAMLTS